MFLSSPITKPMHCFPFLGSSLMTNSFLYFSFFIIYILHHKAEHNTPMKKEVLFCHLLMFCALEKTK